MSSCSMCVRLKNMLPEIFPRTRRSWPIAGDLIACLQMRLSHCCIPTDTTHAGSNKDFRTGGLWGYQSRAEKEHTDEDNRCRDLEDMAGRGGTSYRAGYSSDA